MLPVLTDEQRAAALERAMEARMMRGSLKKALKAGTVTPGYVMAQPEAKRMRVFDLMRALPGIGLAGAERAMRELRISQRRRIKGLGVRQMERLLDWIDRNEH